MFSQNMPNENSTHSNHFRKKEMKTQFDYFIDLCLLKLEKPIIAQNNKVDKHLELLNLEKFAEKIQLFL